MELVLFSGSITSFCCGLIVGPQDPERAFFVSACGYQTTVKAVMARLLENHGVTVKVHSVERYIERAWCNYRYELKRLPSGLAHALMFPVAALPGDLSEERSEFFIFCEPREDPRTLFFQHLDARTDIPLHPSWSGWLWDRFLEREWTEELVTFIGTLKGFRCRFSPEELKECIAAAIKTVIGRLLPA